MRMRLHMWSPLFSLTHHAAARAGTSLGCTPLYTIVRQNRHCCLFVEAGPPPSGPVKAVLKLAASAASPEGKKLNFQAVIESAASAASLDLQGSLANPAVLMPSRVP